MSKKRIHIDASDIQVNPFGGMFLGGYEITVQKVNTEKQCEKCLDIVDVMQCEYHLSVDVYDFEYIGFLSMELRSFNGYTEDEIKDIFAKEINKLLNS